MKNAYLPRTEAKLVGFVWSDQSMWFSPPNCKKNRMWFLLSRHAKLLKIMGSYGRLRCQWLTTELPKTTCDFVQFACSFLASPRRGIFVFCSNCLQERLINQNRLPARIFVCTNVGLVGSFSISRNFQNAPLVSVHQFDFFTLGDVIIIILLHSFETYSHW